MIEDFKDKETERVWSGIGSRRLPADIQQVARRKLRIPPANRLEALKGARKGQYSIRINDQWRICFVWREGNAANVEIVDYH
ncbi:MAG: plasmid maintenance system killer protein [Betaproteobacteria bacterium RBG_16_58_11]|nr:MAG: plasmid maintenance system killer protein [Betaproteobacteria bacterium RBG_16_58_11]